MKPTPSGYLQVLRWVLLVLLGFGLFNLVTEGVRLANGQTQWQRLPSSYDPGISVAEAASKYQGAPLLIEFYADRCATCRRVTPMLHTLLEAGWNTCAHPVMVDVDKPENRDFAGLFAVEEIPRAFFFWPAQMKKVPIPLSDSVTPPQLAAAMRSAWQTLDRDGQMSCSALQ